MKTMTTDQKKQIENAITTAIKSIDEAKSIIHTTDEHFVEALKLGKCKDQLMKIVNENFRYNFGTSLF